jgi:Mn2+/Fe2+ NRAMP family transporter
MRATLAYTTLRLAIFIVALLLLYLIGARGILLIALAALVSAITSFVVLARQREAMSGSISRRITGVRERLDDGAKAEDLD